MGINVAFDCDSMREKKKGTLTAMPSLHVGVAVASQSPVRTYEAFTFLASSPSPKSPSTTQVPPGKLL